MECSVLWPEDHGQQLRNVRIDTEEGMVFRIIPSSQLDVRFSVFIAASVARIILSVHYHVKASVETIC